MDVEGNINSAKHVDILEQHCGQSLQSFIVVVFFLFVREAYGLPRRHLSSAQFWLHDAVDNSGFMMQWTILAS